MNDAPINLVTLPRVDAINKAREIGRRVLADPSVFQVIWPELAGHFGIYNVPWAPDGMDDDEFREVVRVLTREFRAGLQEAISHIAELEG